MLEVYVDGACEPVNPGGTASYGLLVLEVDPERDYSIATAFGRTYGKEGETWIAGKKVVLETSAVIGSGEKMSSSVAEYAALVAFLEWFDDQPTQDVLIKSDSMMLVQQMKGKRAARQGLYIPFFIRAQTLMLTNNALWRNRVKFEWIRGENNLADALSMKALEAIGIKRRRR